MKAFNNSFWIRLALGVAMAPMLLRAESAGPEVAVTGAPPSNKTCTQVGCHTGTGNPFTDGISIDFGAAGATYTPGGAQQTWSMTVPTSSASVYGFQITARQASSAATTPAGTFTASAGQAVLCSDGGVRPPAGCKASPVVEYLEHDGTPLKTNPITIQWTPPATDVGDVTLYVAVNSANGNGQNTGDRITVQNFTLKTAGAQTSAPKIRTDQPPVLQSFSDKAALSPGTWLQIFGSNFSTLTREWAGSDFTGSNAPTSLEGVRVKIAGKDAFVRFISPGQVNVQAPDDIGTGSGVTVELTNANGTSSTTMTAAKVSPALLTTPNFLVGGKQYVAALYSDFTTFVGPTNLIPGVAFRPAKPGDTIIIFAVGCGATNPASPAGVIAPSPQPVAAPITVRLGQTTATAQAFVGGVGLCQFNVTVPTVTAGDIAIEATVDGVATGQNLFTTVGAN